MNDPWLKELVDLNLAQMHENLANPYFESSDHPGCCQWHNTWGTCAFSRPGEPPENERWRRCNHVEGRFCSTYGKMVKLGEELKEAVQDDPNRV